MIEMRLAIVVGHSFDKPGALGIYPLSLREYNWNLDLSNVVYRYAREAGLNARVFLRNNRNLEKTYADVNEWCNGENAVCVELHFNALDGKCRGTETLWDDDPADGIEFAREVHEEICYVLGRKGKLDRGLRKIAKPEERGYLNLKLMKAPGCILEPFFGDNADDAMLGQAKSWEYAKAIVTASYKFMIRKEYENPLLDKQ
jgi:N-acetylmuramoyl-L-alanine amidase